MTRSAQTSMLHEISSSTRDGRTASRTVTTQYTVLAVQPVRNSQQPREAEYPVSRSQDVGQMRGHTLSHESRSDGGIPNILVFGETGTGKSSLINMVAGRNIADVSSDALGCTFGSQAHTVTIDGTIFKLWDTAGLNEGEHGTIPAAQAMQNLQDLVGNLKDGISLLVYCIRGTRFRDIMRINYDLFCAIICQSKVPVVAVITGLENESPMERWWDENGVELEKHRMAFAGHSCVTTTKGKMLKSGDYMFEEEYVESGKAVRKLLKDHCLHSPWTMEKSVWLIDITSRLTQYYEMGGHYEAAGRYEMSGRKEGGSAARERETIHIVGGVAILSSVAMLLKMCCSYVKCDRQQGHDGVVSPS